jgi:hypothetical protein
MTRKHTLSRLLHVLRRHYRLHQLDWQEGILQPPDDGAIVVGGKDGLYVAVSILGRSLSVSVTPPLGDAYTMVYRRQQHASTEEAIDHAPSVAAWALAIASEPPCDDHLSKAEEEETP